MKRTLTGSMILREEIIGHAFVLEQILGNISTNSSPNEVSSIVGRHTAGILDNDLTDKLNFLKMAIRSLSTFKLVGFSTVELKKKYDDLENKWRNPQLKKSLDETAILASTVVANRIAMKYPMQSVLSSLQKQLSVIEQPKKDDQIDDQSE